MTFSTEFDSTNIWVAHVEESGDIYNPCTFNYGGPMYEDFVMLSRMLNFSLVLTTVSGTTFRPGDSDWRQVRDVYNIMNELKKLTYEGNFGAVQWEVVPLRHMRLIKWRIFHHLHFIRVEQILLW